MTGVPSRTVALKVFFCGRNSWLRNRGEGSPLQPKLCLCRSWSLPKRLRWCSCSTFSHRYCISQKLEFVPRGRPFTSPAEMAATATGAIFHITRSNRSSSQAAFSSGLSKISTEQPAPLGATEPSSWGRVEAGAMWRKESKRLMLSVDWGLRHLQVVYFFPSSMRRSLALL